MNISCQILWAFGGEYCMHYRPAIFVWNANHQDYEVKIVGLHFVHAIHIMSMVQRILTCFSFLIEWNAYHELIVTNILQVQKPVLISLSRHGELWNPILFLVSIAGWVGKSANSLFWGRGRQHHIPFSLTREEEAKRLSEEVVIENYCLCSLVLKWHMALRRQKVDNRKYWTLFSFLANCFHIWMIQAGMKRIDAAIDALLPCGFTKETIVATVNKLLKVRCLLCWFQSLKFLTNSSYEIF